MWEPHKIEKLFSITEFYSAFLRICSEDFFFKGESHDFWEMVYVIEGNVIITADERVIKLSKNQLAFHKPNEFHTLRACGEKGASIFVMSFSADGCFMEKFNKKILLLQPNQTKELMRIHDFLRECSGTPNITSSFTPYIDNVFENMCNVQKFKNLLENFLINVSEVRSEERLVTNNETIIYRDAISIIDEAVCENLTVEEIADRCNVSVAYLKKIFSKYAGIGVHSCVLNAKIAYAKQMFDSGSSVTAVSQKLSFSCANYFSIVFKRETGMSPREYKKSIN